MKKQSTNWILEIVQMERFTDYTCTPEYLNEWNKLMAQKHKFFADILKSGIYKTNVEGVGEVAIAYLRKHQLVLGPALDLKMRMSVLKELFKEGDLVDVSGIAIGKGFQAPPQHLQRPSQWNLKQTEQHIHAGTALLPDQYMQTNSRQPIRGGEPENAWDTEELQ
ncbi:hypothetical protein GH714_021553 [Hevea brasiliensis]|uniref:Uncharacterized protein n=1 Tax=Hevea brasiliensis TaxID=3981 RepID=A0A6A6M3F5_HEVBR|nr:hypothetical protein GH714_021553 [Hevea brasiliensis]